jgi:hypothetical protein
MPTVASRAPGPEIHRGSTRLARLDANAAAATMPKLNGRKAKPDFSGE